MHTYLQIFTVLFTESFRMTQPNPLADFRKFLFVAWKHLNLPDPTPVQYDIANKIQHGDKRMIIQAFRLGTDTVW